MWMTHIQNKYDAGQGLSFTDHLNNLDEALLPRGKGKECGLQSTCPGHEHGVKRGGIFKHKEAGEVILFIQASRAQENVKEQ